MQYEPLLCEVMSVSLLTNPSAPAKLFFPRRREQPNSRLDCCAFFISARNNNAKWKMVAKNNPFSPKVQMFHVSVPQTLRDFIMQMIQSFRGLLYSMSLHSAWYCWQIRILVVAPWSQMERKGPGVGLFSFPIILVNDAPCSEFPPPIASFTETSCCSSSIGMFPIGVRRTSIRILFSFRRWWKSTRASCFWGSFFIQLGNGESASLVPNKDFYYHWSSALFLCIREGRTEGSNVFLGGRQRDTMTEEGMFNGREDMEVKIIFTPASSFSSFSPTWVFPLAARHMRLGFGFYYNMKQVLWS